MSEQSVYGIVNSEGRIRAFSATSTSAWLQFFSYPVSDARPCGAPLAEGIKAYEAIGYRCQKVRLIEAEDAG